MKHIFIVAILLFYGSIFTQCGLKEDCKDFSLEKGLVFGTYNATPRLDNGRADLNRLLQELQELNANTYNWLIWHSENDWEDLQLFLPMALKENIAVWVTVVPPSESKPIASRSSEPYGVDYLKWSEEIAGLSLRYPNLVAFSIDDFVHNLKTYNLEYLDEMRKIMKSINPSLKFIPCSYYRQITKDFAEQYEELLDGLLFPYRAESEGGNLQNGSLVESEVEKIRSLFSDKMPIYIDIYSHPHSRLGSSTPAYVEEVIRRGAGCTEGVLIYCHPNPEKAVEKYTIIKREFQQLKNESAKLLTK